MIAIFPFVLRLLFQCLGIRLDRASTMINAQPATSFWPRLQLTVFSNCFSSIRITLTLTIVFPVLTFAPDSLLPRYLGGHPASDHQCSAFHFSCWCRCRGFRCLHSALNVSEKTRHLLLLTLSFNHRSNVKLQLTAARLDRSSDRTMPKVTNGDMIVTQDCRLAGITLKR